MTPEIHSLLRRVLYLMQATDLCIKLEHVKRQDQMSCTTCDYCKTIREPFIEAIVEVENLLAQHPVRR